MKKNMQFPVIDCTKCSRCEKCIGICPEQAIKLVRSISCSRCIRYCLSMDVPCNQYHVEIDVSKCTLCGLCLGICDDNAIFMDDIS